MKRVFLTILSAFAFCALLPGCKTYTIGSSLPKEQRTISLNVSNLTQENALTALVTASVSRRLEGVPGIDVVQDEDKSGLDVTIKLESLDQSRLASAKIRDKRDRDDESDAYQTVLFRQTLKASWSAAANDGSVRKGVVEATADVPLMNNVELSQENALKELARDLAHKVAEAVLN